MKEFIKKVSWVTVANATAMIVSALITIVLPKYISTTEYGYWQMYLLFVTYIGCIHLGLPDGIYLRYSGKTYSEVVSNEIKLLFWISSFGEILIGIVIYLWISRTSIYQMAIAFTLCTAIYVPSLYLKYLILSSNMMKQYSMYILSEKIFAIVAILVGFFAYRPILHHFIYVDICGKLMALIYALTQCRSCFHIYYQKVETLLREYKINVKAGLCLMISTVSSNFIVGVIRLFINQRWSIEDFGRVSFSLQISNFVLAFVRAVSLPLFPVLKMRGKDESVAIYEKIRLTLVSLILFVFIFYYPLAAFLGYWLPDYRISVYYLGILFPICLFEAKQALLCETYLKSFRKERFLLLINLSTMLISMLISGFIVFVLNNQLLAIVFILMILCFRSTVSELFLNKLMNRNILKHIVLEIIMATSFVVSNILFELKYAALFYGVCFTIFVALNRKGYQRLKRIKED